MAEFGIVDLSVVPPPAKATAGSRSAVSGQGVGEQLGSVDTAAVAAALESLREDLASHIKSKPGGLQLTTLSIKLTLGAEGRVAFVAKGTAEACIEVTFSSVDPSPKRGSA
jgi:hypothetical protein